MCRLVATRQQRVATGQGIIDAANKDFDRAALKLGRQINRLRAEQPPEPARKPTPYKPPVLDGLTDEERVHYYRLLTRGATA
jgi:hypothetical protein